MKLGLFVLTITMVAAPAMAAFNPSSLPQTCKDTLAEMQQDKARFSALGKEMQKFRKASDTPNFCTAARQVVIIIKAQSDKLDECVGELANDKTASPDASNQMIQLRGLYKQMLDAAKDSKNDQLKCGLADQ